MKDNNLETKSSLPIKPYLIRAYYECIGDQSLTPYLLVQTRLPAVIVPTKYIDPDDGTIVLNIAAIATNKLIISNEAVQFQARFDGAIWDVYAPIYAIAGIYAAENGEGMLFELDEEEINTAPLNPVSSTNTTQTTTKPHLRVIKNDE